MVGGRWLVGRCSRRTKGGNWAADQRCYGVRGRGLVRGRAGEEEGLQLFTTGSMPTFNLGKNTTQMCYSVVHLTGYIKIWLSPD